MKVAFDEKFLMKLTTFILILMNPYLTGKLPGGIPSMRPHHKDGHNTDRTGKPVIISESSIYSWHESHKEFGAQFTVILSVTVMGWSPPSWFAVWNGARPDTHQPEEFEPAKAVGNTRRHHAWTNDSETTCLSGCRILLKRLSGLREALELVSPWPLVQLVASPGLNRSSSAFVLRRLILPLPLSAHFCRCGLPLDLRGHHRARAGTRWRRVLGQKKRHGTKKTETGQNKQPVVGTKNCIRDKKNTNGTKKNDIWDKIKIGKRDKKT